MRKRIFVISPLRGTESQLAAIRDLPDFEAARMDLYRQNIARAKRLCLDATLKGYAPFAPHLLYPQFLDDRVPAERAAGIDCGLAYLSDSAEVWVDDRDGISEGMSKEIGTARGLAKPIVFPTWWREIR